MKVLLGVSGCIAAYKACEVLRLLQKEGIDVEVVMTENAEKLVGATTFSALSGHPALSDNFASLDDPIPHIRIAEECDLFLIAPCTADVIGKIASGVGDNLLTTCALVAHDKLAVAPAMNVHMYESPAVQSNLETLRSRGVSVVEPGSGYLACGDVGKGRLAEPADIVSAVLGILGVKSIYKQSAPSQSSQGGGPTVVGQADADSSAFKDSITGIKVVDATTPISLTSSSDEIIKDDEDATLTVDDAAESDELAGKRVLVTAGPTRERIDAVRYVTNDSSGKMGYAVAEAALEKGAEVVLVSGPVSLDAPEGVDLVSVESAREMLDAVQDNFDDCNIAVFTAAVADYRPVEVQDRKLKKGKDSTSLMSISMKENPDILATMSSGKGGRYLVGFAAETDDVLANAKRKLYSKGADMIVANEVGAGKTFGKDSSKAWIITDSETMELPEMPKIELARRILSEACANMS